MSHVHFLAHRENALLTERNLGLLKACTFGAGKDISYRGVVFETGYA